MYWSKGTRKCDSSSNKLYGLERCRQGSYFLFSSWSRLVFAQVDQGFLGWLAEESFEQVRAVFMEWVGGLVCYGP